MSTMLRMLRASTPVESFCDVVRMVGMSLFVVLKIAQVLLAERAVVGGDPLAIVRVLARLHLVDEIAHGQRVILRWRRKPASSRSG